MLLEVKKSTLIGSIFVPGSLSHTIRGIIAATLADGVSTLIAPLDSEETNLVLDIIEKFGAKVEKSNNFWKITGISRKVKSLPQKISLGKIDANLELFIFIASLLDCPTTFQLDNFQNSKKLIELFNVLTSLGAKYSIEENSFTIIGPLLGGSAKVDGKTSKKLNALLFTCPFAINSTTLDLDYLNEQPNIAITLDWLDFLGIQYKGTRNLLHWEIPSKQRIVSFTKIIPADFSLAIYPLIAATIVGNGVKICNLDFSDLQEDKKVFSMAERMGANIKWNDSIEEPLTVEASTKLNEVVLDINTTPDALPILAVACLFLPKTSKLINVPQARLKDVDIISSMAKELIKIGAKVEELPDGLIIYGGRKLHGAKIDSHFNFYIAMAFAIAALALDENEVIKIEHAQCIFDCYPNFIDDFRALGANFRIVE